MMFLNENIEFPFVKKLASKWSQREHDTKVSFNGHWLLPEV